MRILWVTAEPPDRGGGGGNIRQSYLLEALAKAHEVDLLLAGHVTDSVVREAVARLWVVPPVQTWRPRGKLLRRVLELVLALWGGPPEIYDSRASLRALRTAWPRDHDYDVVMVEHGQLHSLSRLRRPGQAWTCTLQNIPSDSLATLADLAPGRRQRWLYRRQTKQAKSMEAVILASYDMVFAVSDADAACLPARAEVVPNGVDLDTFVARPLVQGHGIVFTGTLSYWPNVDGLTWFCDEVLPRVQQLVHDATFTIVGRDAPPSILDLGRRPGISVHVDVPSVLPYLERARVAVVPLRFGSGTRLKAAEALSSARPLAGTVVGLMGLGITDEAIIVDDPVALAKGIADLLADDARAASMARRGRALAERDLGWSSIGARFVGLVEQSVQRLAAAPERRR